ncbi:glycosyltransferase [Chryseobacterium sp. Y16C]|uniref:glycosyltransferase n=1 Tax=Chryseobacterium sp. Y16C TaxID=2920939 RepID=UPI001F0BBEB7|nr:glycosyltransferase [Chryseobacterium sp. Y16C]UMQ43806.1 glycosyltransferase [Chryseobacterium sp. Y16C]
MKILQIINSLESGGAEKLLLETIPLYRKAGIEMDILLLWDNDHPFTMALKKLNCCKVYVLNKSYNNKDIYSVANILKLRRYLKQYHIAHVHLFPAQYFVPLANIMNGNRTKLIFTEHNTTNNRIKNYFYKIIDKYFYKLYTLQIAITDEIKNIFQKEYNLPVKFYKVIENGVDLQKIKKATKYSKFQISNLISETDKLIIQVSAFREQKDQDTLIKSLVELPKNIKLILVGDGERKSLCQDLVKKLNLENRIVFLGQRMDVPELLKSSDYIVLSSKYEGLSLSSIEGMASGRPFLASNVPGLKELVDGAGILFEQGNVRELVTKILELENNPSFYNQVAQACQVRSMNFDIHTMVDKHIKLYRKIYKN